MSLVIEKGRVIDPAGGLDGVMDLLIEGKKIVKVAKEIRTGAERRIDAAGLIVSPGFIDLHCHLREPGFEHKETIETGTEAAAAGGFTSVVCMANTHPVNDNAVMTDLIMKKAKEKGIVNVFPVGAISRGLEGKTLADIGQMAEAGIVGISDDGHTVMDSALMRKALQYARGMNLLVISHAEDENLSGTGSINEGLVATELGLPGSPNAAEEVMIARDIALAELTKARLHVAHVTTERGLVLIAAAKRRGVRVTCEATPHHLTLTDEAVRGYNTQAKVRPPLRAEKDRQALRKGLAETVDVIATDHAPHASFEKEVEFVNAANGISGFETALPLSLRLVEEGVISLGRLIELLSCNPARILEKGNLPEGNLPKEKKGRVAEGFDADLTLFDPTEEVTVDPKKFHSKGQNTPFAGWKLKGRVRKTIVAGKVVYSA